jgi:hypothetical protein
MRLSGPRREGPQSGVDQGAVGPSGLAGRPLRFGSVGDETGPRPASFPQHVRPARSPALHAIPDASLGGLLLVTVGVPPLEVADVLGHADLRMVERHYRPQIGSVITEAMSVMDALTSPSKFGSPLGSHGLSGSRPTRHHRSELASRWECRPRSHDLHGVNVFDFVHSDPLMVA